MGLAHLAFSAGMTAYILVAIRFEERDLSRFYGERYEAYRRRVPMLIPRLFPTSREAVAKDAELSDVRGKVR
jgi:protein-S-isoprenylcysteine O-methyltransferase Ste14